MQTTTPLSPFLDTAALAGLRHCRWAPRHHAHGMYAGRHAAQRHGGAGEFADYRSYLPGEDLRRLDWKVLGRTGRPYTRLYQDETNTACVLALDISASMTFAGAPASPVPAAGSFSSGRERPRTAPSKLAYAQYFATGLSQLLGWQQDQVGLALLSDRLHAWHPPAGAWPHIRAVQDALAAITPQATTHLGQGLHELFRAAARRGTVLLLSDFLMDDLAEVFSALRLFAHARWEIITAHVIHPDEEQLPTLAAARFTGLENDGEITCAPGDLAREYAARFAALTQQVRGQTVNLGGTALALRTQVPWARALERFLLQRAAGL